MFELLKEKNTGKISTIHNNRSLHQLFHDVCDVPSTHQLPIWHWGKIHSLKSIEIWMERHVLPWILRLSLRVYAHHSSDREGRLCICLLGPFLLRNSIPTLHDGTACLHELLPKQQEVLLRRHRQTLASDDHLAQLGLLHAFLWVIPVHHLMHRWVSLCGPQSLMLARHPHFRYRVCDDLLDHSLLYEYYYRYVVQWDTTCLRGLPGKTWKQLWSSRYNIQVLDGGSVFVLQQLHLQLVPHCVCFSCIACYVLLILQVYSVLQQLRLSIFWNSDFHILVDLH